ncbi:pilus assembly protein TadG-related protein [Comamonas humi]
MQFVLLGAVLIAMLGVVQIGYMYYAKRDLQRIADLAALETVNAMTYGDPSTCTGAVGAVETGKASIAAHATELNQLLKNRITEPVVCGHWNPGITPRFNPNYGSAPTAANVLNAAQVTLEVEALQLLPFTGARTVAATAMAAKDSQSVASFQIGSQLLRFENTRLLGQIGKTVGLDISRLTVLDKNGIANAKITPAGLLQFLGLPIGVNDLALLTPGDLANVNASLLNLIDAAINAAGDSFLNAGVDVGALQALRAYIASSPIANILVPLGGPNGILATVAGGRNGTIGPGLDVALDIADLVRTQMVEAHTRLVIANQKYALDLKLEIPGLTAAKLTVVEPPTVAIGPADGKTKARSAQVRLSLDINTSGKGSLPTLTDALGIKLHIPIQVDLVRSTGTLEAIQCTATGNARMANISVRSAIGDVCIGQLDANGICQKTRLVDVDVLNLLGGVTIDSKVSTSLLEGASFSSPPNMQACPFNHGTLDECLVNMHVGDQTMSGPNGLRLGQTVTNLLKAIPAAVGDISNAKPNGLLGIVLGLVLALIGGLQGLLNIVVGIVSTLLSPILDVIGGVLDSLLTSLGVELGRAEVELLGIQCDTAQLVN